MIEHLEIEFHAKRSAHIVLTIATLGEVFRCKRPTHVFLTTESLGEVFRSKRPTYVFFYRPNTWGKSDV